jgi:hypothetical protein
MVKRHREPASPFSNCHCEKRSDEAISLDRAKCNRLGVHGALRARLVMTMVKSYGPLASTFALK